MNPESRGAEANTAVAIAAVAYVLLVLDKMPKTALLSCDDYVGCYATAPPTAPAWVFEFDRGDFSKRRKALAE